MFSLVNSGQNGTGRLWLIRYNRHAFYKPVLHCQGFSGLQTMMALALLSVLIAYVAFSYLKLLEQAQLIQIQATAMSMRTSVLQAHELWLLKGSKAGVMAFSNGQLAMSALGWPEAAVGDASGADGKGVAGDLRCRALWHGLLQDSATAAIYGTDRESQYDAMAQEGRCLYRFRDLNHRLQQQAIIEYDVPSGHVTLTIR